MGREIRAESHKNLHLITFSRKAKFGKFKSALEVISLSSAEESRMRLQHIALRGFEWKELTCKKTNELQK
ncbi:unnamed protein product [Allacma fusca]|uniref:Uncharacterized protein n=1 Tax=Allacma fusca TaxID=39272 RepID=A0A8J2LHB7_9HEXA|nr:unnamed protein product [Allacma fusca]